MKNGGFRIGGIEYSGGLKESASEFQFSRFNFLSVHLCVKMCRKEGSSWIKKKK